MSRNGSGTYTLPAGNPVVTGTTIESNWANTTLSDIATTLTDSLSRSGQGGMTAALRVADGTQGAPGVGFANETGSGFYRAGTGEVWAVVQGAQTLNLDASGVYVPADKTTTVDGAFVFNEAGADKDARFEGDTDANLLFLDASTDRVGVGTNTPDAKFTVNGVGAFGDGAVGAPSIANTGDLNTGIWFPAADTVAVSTGGVEAARFDSSGNLGIGTSSPASRLDVAGAFGTSTTAATISNTTGFSASNIARLDFRLNNSFGGLERTAAIWSLNPNATGNNGGALVFGVSANGTATTPSEVARFDQAGNLGLGVTPSAWGSGRTTLQINGTTQPNIQFTGNTTNGGAIWTNAFFDGTNPKYVANGPATIFATSNGASGGGFQWQIAPSGTAGNTITGANAFVQAMTLDASGNLGVGTTSPQRQIETYVAAGGNALQARSSAVTIDTGINSSNDGGFLYTRTNHFLAFGTNNAERARITSGGDLLVGKTADDATTAGIQMVSGGAITLARNSASNCLQINKKGNTGDLMAFYYNDASVVGTITNSSTNTAYNTTSDRRLKENIAPAGDAGPVIDAIEIVQHDWKVGGHTRFGVIAQDLHAVAPEAVSAGDDGDEIERTWGVDYSKLVPMLIKEIQSLRARVAALEAQP